MVSISNTSSILLTNESKEHSHEKKLVRLFLQIIDLVQTKVRQHFFNFYNRQSKGYDFLKEGAPKVKLVSLSNILDTVDLFTTM
jgi:hypothetical protein